MLGYAGDIESMLKFRLTYHCEYVQNNLMKHATDAHFYLTDQTMTVIK